MTKQHNVITWMKLTQVTTLLRAHQQQDVWRMGRGELLVVIYLSVLTLELKHNTWNIIYPLVLLRCQMEIIIA